jgi:hypothetical protein
VYILSEIHEKLPIIQSTNTKMIATALSWEMKTPPIYNHKYQPQPNVNNNKEAIKDTNQYDINMLMWKNEI